MSAPQDVVWREDRAPFQWIGMHLHHAGGIRCNSRKEAERYMRELCGKHDCVWVRAYP
jgi:hypothetical protein